MVVQAGGLPIAIPYDLERIEDYLDIVQGVCIPGGDYAFPAAWYENDKEQSPFEDTPRASFDIQLAEKTLERKRPLLGICAGMQIMAGIKGCLLTADAMSYYDTDIDHLNQRPAEEEAHSISIESGTLLHRILEKESVAVNTAHKEAVVKLGDETLIVSAKAPDGVIEAIEITTQPFALGVQWHPEFFLDTQGHNQKIIQAFVKAAGNSNA
jgi:putative glutamine amidotransferase